VSNWWAQKLANQGQTIAPSDVPAPQPQPQAQSRYQPQPQVWQRPPLVPEGAHRLPASASQSGLCPNCGSGNYMAAPGSSYQRCLDCGYPLVQSGSGMGTVHSDTPVKAAVQVPTEGYQPTRIIGRVE
jgi:ribosomal protein S27AE